MNLLRQILDSKRDEVEHAKAACPLEDCKRRAASAAPVRGFQKAIEAADRPALIAEIKRASPVLGPFRADIDAAALARIYESAGASCLSVLTDARYFQGAPEDLVRARDASRLPVLRKDFIVDEYQVYEARAMGADAVLLIVNGLSNTELRELRELAESLGMDALIEAHSEEEAEAALESGTKLLGINNRDLETFELSADIGVRILPRYRGRAVLVSESALRSREDVARAHAAGADAVLIGTAFCQAQPGGEPLETSVPRLVREIMGW
jgi:indole-3-glycerol phosphate synthase